MSDTGVTGQGLEVLRHCAKLKVLDLAGCTPIADYDLAHLAGLTELIELVLGHPKISDSGLMHLFGLKKLKNLELNSDEVSPAGIARLLAAIPEASIDYFWKFKMSQKDENVVFESKRLTVVFQDALLKLEDEDPADSGIDQKPRDEGKRDLIAGELKLSGRKRSLFATYSGDTQLSIAYDDDDVAQVSLRCPRVSQPQTIALYHFELRRNGGLLTCGDQRFDLDRPVITVEIKPDGSALSHLENRGEATDKAKTIPPPDAPR